MRKKEFKEITFNIRMSREDKEKLKTLAKKEGMGMSAYIREMTLGQRSGIYSRDSISDVLERLDQFNNLLNIIRDTGDENMKEMIEKIDLNKKAERGANG